MRARPAQHPRTRRRPPLPSVHMRVSWALSSGRRGRAPQEARIRAHRHEGVIVARTGAGPNGPAGSSRPGRRRSQGCAVASTTVRRRANSRTGPPRRCWPTGPRTDEKKCRRHRTAAILRMASTPFSDLDQSPTIGSGRRRGRDRRRYLGAASCGRARPCSGQATGRTARRIVGPPPPRRGGPNSAAQTSSALSSAGATKSPSTPMSSTGFDHVRASTLGKGAAKQSRAIRAGPPAPRAVDQRRRPGRPAWAPDRRIGRVEPDMDNSPAAAGWPA